METSSGLEGRTRLRSLFALLLCGAWSFAQPRLVAGEADRSGLSASPEPGFLILRPQPNVAVGDRLTLNSDPNNNRWSQPPVNVPSRRQSTRAASFFFRSAVPRCRCGPQRQAGDVSAVERGAGSSVHETTRRRVTTHVR